MSTTTKAPAPPRPPSDASAAPQQPQPQLQTRAGSATNPPGVNVPPAELRRLMAAICELRDGGEGEGGPGSGEREGEGNGVLDTALVISRAIDRYHPYWVASRKDWKEEAATAARPAYPTAVLQPHHHMRTYGVHLRQGVMLALTPPGDIHSEAGRWTAAQAAAAAAAGGGGDEVRWE
ncbi:hypothetical protein HYH02_014266 [Chlamydomonas schloesseri]|uniref:Uncharacterized protein n=1 Tax=Chlamydomonas schloesseri TaxID=2026947 RepID=A0A835SV74_9CHLO|nr:hypothetical protein HYH02_014266 [Chlamydomonas schloesseri]|eukprot:KAG2428854.1 hypothetical protein HYH02_014266 [Chlamydomonas schloesseri]